MLKNVELLLRMMECMKDVGAVDTVNGLSQSEKERPEALEVPKCMIANCYYKEVITDFKIAEKIQYNIHFADYFGCTKKEAEEVLFDAATGADYAANIENLLRRYGHLS